MVLDNYFQDDGSGLGSRTSLSPDSKFHFNGPDSHLKLNLYVVLWEDDLEQLLGQGVLHQTFVIHHP